MCSLYPLLVHVCVCVSHAFTGSPFVECLGCVPALFGVSGEEIAAQLRLTLSIQSCAGPGCYQTVNEREAWQSLPPPQIPRQASELDSQPSSKSP